MTPPVIEQSLQVPPIAPDFRTEPKPLPPLNRVGVDMEQQRPLSLREALTAALENNKDIEVARQNVKIAEFDLQGSRGAYDPRFNSQSFFERSVTPISSFLSGGSNGAVTQSDFTNTARLEGLTPKLGRQLSAGFLVHPTEYRQPVYRAKSSVSDRAYFQLHATSAAWTQG